MRKKMTHKRRKRPCRICGKWFIPDPRVGDRQKTCGRDECKRKWHIKKCSQWNREHPDYFREIYLGKKLAGIAAPSKASVSERSTGKPGLIPRNLVQEVIGTQQLVVTEYITRLLFKSFQEVIHAQLAEILKEPEPLPPRESSRGDSLWRGT